MKLNTLLYLSLAPLISALIDPSALHASLSVVINDFTSINKTLSGSYGQPISSISKQLTESKKFFNDVVGSVRAEAGLGPNISDTNQVVLKDDFISICSTFQALGKSILQTASIPQKQPYARDSTDQVHEIITSITLLEEFLIYAAPKWTNDMWRGTCLLHQQWSAGVYYYMDTGAKPAFPVIPGCQPPSPIS